MNSNRAFDWKPTACSTLLVLVVAAFGIQPARAQLDDHARPYVQPSEGARQTETQIELTSADAVPSSDPGTTSTGKEITADNTGLSATNPNSGEGAANTSK